MKCLLLEEKGVLKDHITLHVSWNICSSQTEDIREHKMHSETFTISEQTAERLNNRKENKRQICIGTTTCRALESAASSDGRIQPGDYETDIFIYPGYTFKYVKHLLTNFHQPGSSLLLLVSAFASHELIKEAYEKPLRSVFVFSYGDAMLIL